MPNETVRVRYIVPVEVGGVRHPADSYEAEVSQADADALVSAGRALICGEPLKVSDEERAALPSLGHAEPGGPTSVGTSESGIPADHQL